MAQLEPQVPLVHLVYLVNLERLDLLDQLDSLDLLEPGAGLVALDLLGFLEKLELQVEYLKIKSMFC